MVATMSEREDEAAQPQVGRPLPEAGRAYVDLDKLARYALDPSHPVGRHKARVFKAALAIGQDAHNRAERTRACSHHCLGDRRRAPAANDYPSCPKTTADGDRLRRAMALWRAHELDTVELTREVEGWPMGARGAVVSEYADTALVEMGTEDRLEGGLPGRELLDDLVSVPYEALRVVRAARVATR
jgi:hypothetical protein